MAEKIAMRLMVISGRNYFFLFLLVSCFIYSIWTETLTVFLSLMYCILLALVLGGQRDLQEVIEMVQMRLGGKNPVPSPYLMTELTYMLCHKRGIDTIALEAYFNTKSPFIGDKTPIEFIEERGEEGIRGLIAMEARSG